MEYAGRDLEAMDFAERYHAWIAAELSPFLGARVAEVGAGTGAFTRLLLASPAVRQVVAVEPSAAMHAELSGRLGADARVTLHQALFRDVASAYEGALDSVVYVNVLEHVQDDAAELALARSALRPGGHVCLFVPALPWLYSRFDAAIGHHRRYGRRELVARVRAAGLDVVRADWFDVAGILPWLVAFRLMGRTLGGGQVRVYDRLVVPVARRVEALVRPPIGKNLLVVGRVPGGAA